MKAHMQVPVDAVSYIYIISEYDTPGKMLAFAFATLVVVLTIPLWAGPLMGISILQGYLFLAVFFITSNIFRIIGTNRAYKLILERANNDR